MRDGRRAAKRILYLVGALWGIWGVVLLNDILGILPNIEGLGIVPRSTMGLLGICTAPFLHTGFGHLISNTIPLVVLGFALFYFYQRTAWEALAITVFLGGFGVWLFGRDMVHIGSSLMVFGVAAYLVGSGLFRKKIGSILLAFGVLLFYGTTLLWGLVPTGGSLSWESHLWGGVAGGVAAYLYRKRAQ